MFSHSYTCAKCLFTSFSLAAVVTVGVTDADSTSTIISSVSSSSTITIVCNRVMNQIKSDLQEVTQNETCIPSVKVFIMS